jgi:hypothetical protein
MQVNGQVEALSVAYGAQVLVRSSRTPGDHFVYAVWLRGCGGSGGVGCLAPVVDWTAWLIVAGGYVFLFFFVHQA